MKLLFLLTTGFIMLAVSAYTEENETAAYTVDLSEGAYELRTYADMAVVSTKEGVMRGGSFMRLFRYISGKNTSNTEIAMTTPVFESDTPQETRMYFVLPSQYQNNGSDIPAPANNAVVVDTIAGGRFAAFKYTGRARTQRARSPCAHSCMACRKTTYYRRRTTMGYLQWTPCSRRPAAQRGAYPHCALSADVFSFVIL